MKALIIGDVHLSDRPPSIRTETYTEDILDKIRFAVSYAKDVGCDVIVQAGDMWHIKTPTRTSHALVQETGKALTSTGLPVKIVPGNHDMSNDRIESLRKQPLGTLAKMKGIELLIGPDKSGLPLFGLPYLHDWSTQLSKWMQQFEKWSGEHKSEDMEFLPLMVTHAPIFPSGESPPYEFIDAADWATMMQNGDCYYGHIHDVHGTYVPLAGVAVTMCNQGALSRGSLHEATLKREPAVTVWDSEQKDRFQRVPVPFRPVETVFRLKEKEDVDEKTNRVEEFLENIGKTSLDGLSLEEVTARAAEVNLAPRTQKLVKELLEAVG